MLDTILGLQPIPPGFSSAYSPAFLKCVPTPKELVRLPYGVVPSPPVEVGERGEPNTLPAGTRTLWKVMSRSWTSEMTTRLGVRILREGKVGMPHSSHLSILAPSPPLVISDLSHHPS